MKKILNNMKTGKLKDDQGETTISARAIELKSVLLK